MTLDLRKTQVLSVIPSPTPPAAKMGFTRRRFLQMCGVGAVSVAGSYVYGTNVETGWLTLEEHTLRLPGLAGHWVGKRIVHLTDLHASDRVEAGLIERAFALAMECKPELIVVTGDWVTDSCGWFVNIERGLKLVNGRVPVLGCLGNHDFGRGADHPSVAAELTRRLEARGVMVLRNNWWQGGEIRGKRATPGELVIVGVDDLLSECFDPTVLGSVQSTLPGARVIVMAHNPDSYEFLASYRWQAMLCGHTHGGQIRVPLLGALHVPVHHRERANGFWYPEGEGGRVGYTSRGVGHWLKVRINCRPEVTCFTLA